MLSLEQLSPTLLIYFSISLGWVGGFWQFWYMLMRCSRYVAFVEHIHLNDNVTLIFLTNQRPRNWLTQQTHNTWRRINDQLTGRPCFTSRRLQKDFLDANNRKNYAFWYHTVTSGSNLRRLPPYSAFLAYSSAQKISDILLLHFFLTIMK